MVQFLELIISGQEKIRTLWRKQQESCKFKEKAARLLEQPNIFETTTEIGPFTIPAIEEDGKEIFIQSTYLFSAHHKILTNLNISSNARWNSLRP